MLLAAHNPYSLCSRGHNPNLARRPSDAIVQEHSDEARRSRHHPEHQVHGGTGLPVNRSANDTIVTPRSAKMDSARVRRVASTRWTDT